MEKLEMKLVRPFGPSVIHAKIPVNTVEMLNKYIDGIVADKKKSSSLDHGHKLVGDVTQEFMLEPVFKCLREPMGGMGIKKKNLKI